MNKDRIRQKEAKTKTQDKNKEEHTTLVQEEMIRSTENIDKLMEPHWSVVKNLHKKVEEDLYVDHLAKINPKNSITTP